MTGLTHDFMLLNCAEHPVDSWQQRIHNPDAIRIHDDVLAYMADTLEWIPTYNPAAEVPSQGLCWYGPTIIQENGAKLAANIFGSWADLFSCGPSELKLTGQFSWQVANKPKIDGFERVVHGSAQYERLILNRDHVTLSLRTLASYAEQVARAGGMYYILHLGI